MTGGSGWSRSRSRGDRWRRLPPRPELNLFSSAFFARTVASNWPSPWAPPEVTSARFRRLHFRPLHPARGSGRQAARSGHGAGQGGGWVWVLLRPSPALTARGLPLLLPTAGRDTRWMQLSELDREGYK